MNREQSADHRGHHIDRRRIGGTLLGSLAVVGACATAERPPSGPPPEYIPPRVLPWDAGSAAEPGDPFAAAAAGDWLTPPEASQDAAAAGPASENPLKPVEAEAAPGAAGDADAGHDGGGQGRPPESSDSAAEGTGTGHSTAGPAR
jgi:hypothetical protein